MQRSTATARWRAIALVASIVGAAASAYLLVEYVTGQPGVCLTGSGCDLVRASAFAYPLGIPTPLIGLVFYLAAAWVVLRTLDLRPVAGVAAGMLLLALAAAGAIASMVLTGLEAFVIRAFCTWCLVQAGASLVLLAAAVALPRGEPSPSAGGTSRRSRLHASQVVEEERRGLVRTAQFGGSGAALAVAAMLAVGATGGAPSSSPDGSSLAPAGSPHLGNGPVEVVEFADFQCPGCAVVAPILADIAGSDGMTLVSRYFPLVSIHANADSSARAAAAAARLDAFWEMSAAIYARQSAWKDLAAADADAFFKTLAQDLGLDVEAWQAAYASSEIAAVVDTDRQAAEGMGLRGTPALFIDGQLYNGPLTSEAIRAAIAAAAPAP
ncbi:MAG: vitamin K epoxide reductase family protein [Candidatus Limnocylindria bacterium]